MSIEIREYVSTNAPRFSVVKLQNGFWVVRDANGRGSFWDEIKSEFVYGQEVQNFAMHEDSAMEVLKTLDAKAAK